MTLPAVARARSGLSAPGRAALDMAGLAAALPLAAAAFVRGGKAVHPAGVVHAARVVLAGVEGRSLGFLGEPGEHEAIVRFSRSVGLPRPLPDLLGMTLRLVEAHGPGHHQDFMLVSSVDRPVAHHVFVPAGDVQQRPYSSSLPYAAGEERFLVGALPHDESPRPEGDDEFDRLGAAAATGRLRFHLAVAAVGGRFEPVGEIRVGERLPGAFDATRFNPWNTGGGIEPAGVLNRLRAYAYPASQAAWRSRSAAAPE